MCIGKIVKIWIQDEPMDVVKATTMSEWSVNLYDLAGKGWQVARPKLICMGGGSGFYKAVITSIYDKKWGLGEGEGTKSIKNVLVMEGHIVQYSHISGWHGYKSLMEARSAGYSKEWASFLVQFRGLMQRSSQGELVASEMQVLGVL